MTDTTEPTQTQIPVETPEIKQAVSQMMAAREGKQVAIRFTPDGEAPVFVKDGEEKTFLPAFEPLQPLPAEFTQADHEAMGILYGCIHKIRSMARRHIPLTRSEYLKQGGVTKKTIRRLERYGLLQERVIRLLQSNGKLYRAAACVYPTPQGRAYILEKIDPDYAKEVTGGRQEPDPRSETLDDAAGAAGEAGAGRDEVPESDR